MNLKLNYSGSSNRKVLSRYKKQLLVLAPLLLIGIGPLIADQVTNPDPQSSTSDTSTVQSSVSPSPIASPTDSPSQSPSVSASSTSTTTSQTTQSESGTASVAPSPTKIPPHAVANQNMMLQIPRVLRVDPRATQINLPSVNFFPYGSPYLMLCMNSSPGIIDVETKGIDDTFSGKDIFIKNDYSNAVQISGTSSQVLNIFNSYGGLRLKGAGGKGVAGTNLFMRFVAISEPTDNFALCGQSASTSQWLLEVQPLGLQVDTKKNPLTLGDKKK